MREAILAHIDQPEKMYSACGQAYLRMALDHPQHFRLMMSGGVRPSEDRPELMLAACRTFALLKLMIERCQRAGVIAAGDPYHRALQCWAIVHGFAALYSEGRLEWTGVTYGNATAALRLILEQARTGMGLSALPERHAFRAFAEDTSISRKQNMQLLELQLLQEIPQLLS